MDRCAGLDEAAVEGRMFSNGKRLSGPSIADHTVAMMLSLALSLPAYHRAQQDSSWERALARDVTFGELEGKTMLVVGLGGGLLSRSGHFPGCWSKLIQARPACV